MMALCGVDVPPSVLPAPVRALSEVLPLTHGLMAVRLVLAGRSLTAAAGPLALELATGAGWFLAALLILRRLETRSRRDGRILFAD